MNLFCRCVATIALVQASMPATAQDQDWRTAAVERAINYHRMHVPEDCGAVDHAPQATYDLPIGEDTAARKALLLQFSCKVDTSVFLLSDERGGVSGIELLTPFVVNTSEINASFGSARDQVRVDWRDSREVVEPEYDEGTRVLSATRYWGNEQEPRSMTRWGFRDGRFQLMDFAVDATVNGQNDPEVLFKSQLW